MKSTAIIRQRGQLTIPDKLRRTLSWLKENAVVSIIATSTQELVIKPISHTTDTPDWDEIWRLIHLTRSFKGTGKAKSLTQFIIEDRERH